MILALFGVAHACDAAAIQAIVDQDTPDYVKKRALTVTMGDTCPAPALQIRAAPDQLQTLFYATVTEHPDGWNEACAGGVDAFEAVQSKTGRARAKAWVKQCDLGRLGLEVGTVAAWNRAPPNILLTGLAHRLDDPLRDAVIAILRSPPTENAVDFETVSIVHDDKKLNVEVAYRTYGWKAGPLKPTIHAICERDGKRWSDSDRLGRFGADINQGKEDLWVPRWMPQGQDRSVPAKCQVDIDQDDVHFGTWCWTPDTTEPGPCSFTEPVPSGTAIVSGPRRSREAVYVEVTAGQSAPAGQWLTNLRETCDGETGEWELDSHEAMTRMQPGGRVIVRRNVEATVGCTLELQIAERAGEGWKKEAGTVLATTTLCMTKDGVEDGACP